MPPFSDLPWAVPHLGMLFCWTSSLISFKSVLQYHILNNWEIYGECGNLFNTLCPPALVYCSAQHAELMYNSIILLINIPQWYVLCFVNAIYLCLTVFFLIFWLYCLEFGLFGTLGKPILYIYLWFHFFSVILMFSYLMMQIVCNSPKILALLVPLCLC